MTVGELKNCLKDLNDDMNVEICIETPGGFVCPDGATCSLHKAVEGFDWHMNELLLIPRYRLRLCESETDKWEHQV